jgi:hypothetical protein
VDIPGFINGLEMNEAMIVHEDINSNSIAIIILLI